LANIAPEEHLCTKGFQRKGAEGAMFFYKHLVIPVKAQSEGVFAKGFGSGNCGGVFVPGQQGQVLCKLV
jgi:hypothetical protein